MIVDSKEPQPVCSLESACQMVPHGPQSRCSYSAVTDLSTGGKRTRMNPRPDLLEVGGFWCWLNNESLSNIRGEKTSIHRWYVEWGEGQKVGGSRTRGLEGREW